MKSRFGLAAVLFLLLASRAALAQQPTPTPAPSPSPPQTVATPAPQATLESRKANQRPVVSVKDAPEPFDGATVERMAAQCVTLETERGEVLLEMLPEVAPESARNFLNLAATGALDTTTFSRVVPGFVVQGGNLSTSEKPTTALALRSRRTIPDEPSAVKHTRGVVSMARPEEANMATTNFFILVNDAPHLDGTFSAFARVTRGMEVVDKINREPVNGEKPTNPVRIKRATVAPCPAAETKTPEE